MRFLPLLALTLFACEPALPEPGPEEVDGGVQRIVTRAEGDALVSAIDATNVRTWVALDLDTGEEVTFDPPVWDLAFNRFHIRARGGASGDGDVQVAILKDTTFDAVTQAPADGFMVDQPDGDDENADLDTVFEVPEPWYSYDITTHILTPQPWVYVVKSDEARFYKVVIESYYDGAGTPARLTLRYAPLP